MQKCDLFFESLDRSLLEREKFKNATGGADMFAKALPQALSIAGAYGKELSKRGYALACESSPQRLDLELAGPAPGHIFRASLAAFGPGLALEFSGFGEAARRIPSPEWDPTVFEGLLQNLIEKLVLKE